MDFQLYNCGGIALLRARSPMGRAQTASRTG
jgi:hypothetical protein